MRIQTNSTAQAGGAQVASDPQGTPRAEAGSPPYRQIKLALSENPNWQKIKPAARARLLKEAGITEIGELNIGDDAGLITALSERSLPVWAATADALPERFRQTAWAAAKLLEPKIQSVKLKSGTLRTPEEVKAWLEETEEALLEKLRNGPVVIG